MARDRCQEPNPCRNNKFRMPCDWINIVMSDVENPTGIWADYNVDMKRYLAYERMTPINKLILCEDDLANAPDPDNYSNLTLTRTRGPQPPPEISNSIDTL